MYRCGTRENAPKKAQPSKGSFDEVEPEGYASSRAGFSTWRGASRSRLVMVGSRVSRDRNGRAGNPLPAET